MNRLMVAVVLAFASVCPAETVIAQSYPARSVQVIVPFAGGSASDVVTRVLLERMGTSMGRRFIIDNRPGAGGNTGTAASKVQALKRAGAQVCDTIEEVVAAATAAVGEPSSAAQR